MTIDMLQNGDTAIITALNVDRQLKDRFFSFGFLKSKKIKKIESSLKGSTILVELDKGCIILRSEEAKRIEVEKVNG
ncbi:MULTISPECIES: FeoA family protein [Helicobacter]|uniref:FeoA family protein n=1 Tax=Helicobacter ibis TaxID=2962633 RepID=A0ABT4VE21_9HELI|nr:MULTISPECIES: FeoA family protein [Helicobacter]MDA3966436.1 FeoA family protein [Helicobacter sp. WB40]MDA3968949.1 FeoA family protein [Helicobacter ibis]